MVTLNIEHSREIICKFNQIVDYINSLDDPGERDKQMFCLVRGMCKMFCEKNNISIWELSRLLMQVK